jgi:chromosome segregation ATPase
MEHALRQIADYEEQVRQAHVQVTAYASEADRARQRADSAEKRLREAEEKVSVKAEQALSSQEALVEKAERFAREVTDLRREQAVCLAKASEQKTALEVRVSNLEARLSEATLGRQEAQAALKQSQVEAAVRESRLEQLEKVLAGTATVDAERGELEKQARLLGAEMVGLRQALANEKEAVRQAEAQNAALQSALEAAKARRESESSLADIGEELKLVRRQVETLSAQLHRGDKPLAEKPAATERIEAEPVDAEVLPPERPKGAGGNETQSGGGAASDRQRKPVEAPPVSNQARTLSGLSMADLEQQARRELERLGAQGANLFKKKR